MSVKVTGNGTELAASMVKALGPMVEAATANTAETAKLAAGAITGALAEVNMDDVALVAKDCGAKLLKVLEEAGEKGWDAAQGGFEGVHEAATALAQEGTAIAGDIVPKVG